MGLGIVAVIKSRPPKKSAWPLSLKTAIKAIAKDVFLLPYIAEVLKDRQ